MDNFRTFAFQKQFLNQCVLKVFYPEKLYAINYISTHRFFAHH